MIYYFSGTGNSREIAERIAKATKDYAVGITYSLDYIPESTKSLGFVFPVYAWGIPKIMIDFVQQLQISQIPPYVFMVCTCGDDIGLTHQEFIKLLQKKHLRVDAIWSVIMPNTYISLPGFDIDTTSVAKQKIVAAQERVLEICDKINQQERHIVDVKLGDYPWLKSKVLRPLFNVLLTGDKQFSVNKDCIHCGICANVCPKCNINYSSDGRPYWNGDCADCLACYHSCPQHAINYGPFTSHKGQYLFQKIQQHLQRAQNKD